MVFKNLKKAYDRDPKKKKICMESFKKERDSNGIRVENK